MRSAARSTIGSPWPGGDDVRGKPVQPAQRLAAGILVEVEAARAGVEPRQRGDGVPDEEHPLPRPLPGEREVSGRVPQGVQHLERSHAVAVLERLVHLTRHVVGDPEQGGDPRSMQTPRRLRPQWHRMSRRAAFDDRHLGRVREMVAPLSRFRVSRPPRCER